MNRARNAVPALARAQWAGLKETLEKLGCEVSLVPPQPRLPDMVFTANAGLVVGDGFVRSNFRFRERQGEVEHFERWFCERGYEVVPVPEDCFFEGEGDALFCGDVLICGYRFRSDVCAHQMLGERFSCLTLSVELVEARFYHLDTCFCPLPDGGAAWYPAAFDGYGQKVIREHTRYLIDVAPEEAGGFACNAVVVDRDVVLPESCPRLGADLTERGYRPHPLPMTEFMKAGGACKCLVLLLPQREMAKVGPAEIPRGREHNRGCEA